MITTDEISIRMEKGAGYLVDTLAKDFPIVNLAKPMISRVVKNSMGKVTKYCELLADEKGMVDFNSLVDEIFANAINSKPFTIPAGSLGDIEFGGGSIKVPIPFTQKVASFGTEEINAVKRILKNL
jgi:hypothetical protein